jgi:precorrin-6x reductase
MKKLLLFGGTTEGRELSAMLIALGFHVTVCVATDYGGSLMQDNSSIVLHIGRLTKPEMANFMLNGGFFAVIDATHPYAVEASDNIKRAAEAVGVRYLRLIRLSVMVSSNNILHAGSAEEAVSLLEGLPGNILLTTGSKDLGAYTKLAAYRERIWLRVLPSPDSLAKCLSLGFPPAHVICMQGPFIRELNTAMLKQYDIKIMVTKDTGAEGGFLEKAEAAADAGARLIVIKRSSIEDGLSINQLLEVLKKEFMA